MRSKSCSVPQGEWNRWNTWNKISKPLSGPTPNRTHSEALSCSTCSACFTHSAERNGTSRINARCAALGKENVILVSIHVNAQGNGSEWTKASGWSIYTSKGNTAADELADCIAEAAKINLPTMRLRCDLQDGDFDYEEDFYILRKTLCPCVLSENGFMTNEKECRWLQTEEALSALVKTHVEGIVNYLATL